MAIHVTMEQHVTHLIIIILEKLSKQILLNIALLPPTAVIRTAGLACTNQG